MSTFGRIILHSLTRWEGTSWREQGQTQEDPIVPIWIYYRRNDKNIPTPMAPGRVPTVDIHISHEINQSLKPFLPVIPRLLAGSVRIDTGVGATQSLTWCGKPFLSCSRHIVLVNILKFSKNSRFTAYTKTTCNISFLHNNQPMVTMMRSLIQSRIVFVDQNVLPQFQEVPCAELKFVLTCSERKHGK